MKIAFHTLGCKVNQYETEALREDFLARGHEIVDEEEAADVYIINTCTVTGLADRKSRQFLRRRKREHPEALLVATGCYVQGSPEEVEATGAVDLLVGVADKQRIPQLVEETLARRDGREDPLRYCTPVEDQREYGDEGIITTPVSRSRAYLKIQDGCDRYCSYCTIPRVRGPVRSRPMESVLAEAEHLISAGFRELILTGINTALYDDLVGLLARLEAMPGDFRVRLSSLEPTVVDHEYVKKLLGFSRLCHHLHLSMQSGSDRILKAMNRPYSREDYLRIVDVLRNFDPCYGITTDMIVGFPGEKEEDFRKTLDAVERCLFGKVHVFRYSPRPETAARTMDDQVPGVVKKERAGRLTEMGNQVAGTFLKKNEGSVRRVLWEQRETDPETEQDLWSGYADNYIRVYERIQKDNEDRGDREGRLGKVKLETKYLQGMLGSTTRESLEV